MNERLKWMLASVELPRIGSIQIRISAFFLFLGLLLGIRLGWGLGGVVFGVWTVSVLLHELGHVVMARLTGGTATEIHLTPFGGVAIAQSGRGVLAQLVTTAAGPFVNLTICLAAFPNYYAPDVLWGVLDPIHLPISQLTEGKLLRDLGLVTFTINWVLLLLNLLPTLPLDGGRILRILLMTRIHPEVVDRRAIQISMIFGAIVAFAGLMGDWSIVVFIGAFLFAFNMVQIFEEESGDKEDDSFLGYDFSEGYTSLDRSAPAPTVPVESQRGILERWRERWKMQREQAIRRQQHEAERQLDDLLAKVHAHGMDSLTSREKKLLRQVSDLLRDRGKRPS